MLKTLTQYIKYLIIKSFFKIIYSMHIEYSQKTHSMHNEYSKKKQLMQNKYSKKNIIQYNDEYNTVEVFN